ncbi:MAG TPA: FHA domain-containing protein, partial [Holophagaceae bacterium]|nr:FHA domain-containing protein [Holophagaceae bacterium]
MAKLLVQESGAEPREFDLVDAEVHIGRELDNALRIPDPSISRHHCVIRKAGKAFEIQDLQSSNGVLINGNRVQASPLKHGDRVTLGQIQITFLDPDAAPDEGATVAIQAMGAENPAGTVRMRADQMAAIHAGAAPKPPVSLPPPPA